jgi:hypothetical protein
MTVRLKLPTALFDAAFSVNVLRPPPGEAILTGAKLPVTPLGTPLTDSPTPDLNPLIAVVVNVIGIAPPRARITLALPSVRVKLGTTTVKLSA